MVESFASGPAVGRKRVVKRGNNDSEFGIFEDRLLNSFSFDRENKHVGEKSYFVQFTNRRNC